VTERDNSGLDSGGLYEILVVSDADNVNSLSLDLIDELLANGYDFSATEMSKLLACLLKADESNVSAALEADDFLRAMREDGLL